MHSFQFKIKGYLSEVGEYTEYFPAEPGTILQFVIQHWFNESIPNNLDCIVVKNAAGDRLLIDHVKRDVFDYYLVPVKMKKGYFHRKTDIQLMFFVLENFFSNRLEDIQSNLKEKDDEDALVRGDLMGKSFLYRITRATLWRNLNGMIYQVFFLVTFVIVGLVINPLLLIIVLVFVVFSVATNYKRFQMYRAYYFDNREIEITISRANDQMLIKKGAWTRSIPKTDIRKITRYVAPPDDVHAHADFFMEIEFLNGDVLNVTSLLIAQADADGKFMHNLIPFDVVVTKDGFLNRKTDMPHYFSAIGLNN